jgi:hypothetical protein
VGAVRKPSFELRRLSLTALEDIWLRRATAIAVEQARAAVSGGAVPPNTPVGRLGDVEWGWIVAAVLFGWIKTRAEQATSSGVGPNELIGTTNIDPDPWDAGAIASILPELGNSGLDWNKSLSQFSRAEMEAFLGDALTLIRKAMAARDRGQGMVTRRTPAGTAYEARAELPDDPNDSLDGI